MTTAHESNVVIEAQVTKLTLKNKDMVPTIEINLVALADQEGAQLMDHTILTELLKRPAQVTFTVTRHYDTGTGALTEAADG